MLWKGQSVRRRTRRIDLESAGEERGRLSRFLQSERLFDCLVGVLFWTLQTLLFTAGFGRLDGAALCGIALVLLAGNLLFAGYVALHHPELFGDRRGLVLVQTLTLGAFALARVFITLGWPELLFPLGVFSISLSIPYGQRFATFWTVLAATGIGLLRGLELFNAPASSSGRLATEISFDFSLAVTLASGSIVAVFALPKVTRRKRVIEAGIYAGLAFAAITVVTRFLLAGSDWLAGEISKRPGELALLVALGFLNGLFTGYFMVEFGLRFVESAFDVVTDLRLQELADLNQPILKKFALEAPGTFHHSQMVGTLGEAAAEAIGANPLLCRVGAHFHDIGKLAKPEYFIENQCGGVNKHIGLTPSMSTLIIASHVKDGIEMAEDLGLPPCVIDFIPEHHGTIAVEYFYQAALRQHEEHGGPPVDIDAFRYPGPKPQSKETAILMIADTVEAVSRLLSEPNPARVDAMVREVVMKRLTDGQFDECGITMKELAKVRQAMGRVLLGFFHARVKYPRTPGLEPAPAAAGDDTARRLKAAVAMAEGPGTPSAAANAQAIEGPPDANRATAGAPAPGPSGGAKKNSGPEKAPFAR